MSETAFKVFETEKEFNDFKDKAFKNGYNEHKGSIMKSLNLSLGKEYESVEALTNEFKELEGKVSEGITDATKTPEYADLQTKLKAEREARENAERTATEIDNRYKFDSTWNESFSELTKDAKPLIAEDKIKRLFSTDYSVEWEDGKPIVKQDGKTVTDDNANPKSLNQVIADYSKEYIVTTAEGTGGGSGTGSGGKVKRSDFNNAIQSGDSKKAETLFNQGEESGWVEE
jgi:phage regulator Rha-like protein